MQRICRDLDNCNIGVFIDPHDLGIECPSVVQAHTDLMRTRDNVAVGNDVTRLSIHDDPGAEAADTPFTLLHRRGAEELFEERI